MSKKSDVWQALIQSVAAVEAQLGEIMQKRHGLGLSEYRALQLLSRAPKSEMRMQELAARLRLNQSSISRLVERLERNSLTERDVCPDDKRGVFTVLTVDGRKRFESARETYEKTLEAAVQKNGCAPLLVKFDRRSNQ